MADAFRSSPALHLSMTPRCVAIGAINMLVDITERKQAENRQKVLIDELNLG